MLPNIKAPKNGYAYVYLSNESPEPVYFDNFKVGLTRGRIIEEDHYYAFGLKIAAISSEKTSDPNEGNFDNKNLYNDKELYDDADLDWYNYGFRSHDAQVGRFVQRDPLTWDFPELTNYQYAGNDPILNVDMDGLEPCVAGISQGVGYAGTQQLNDVVVTGVTNTAAKAGISAALKGVLQSTTANIFAITASTVSSIKNIPNNLSNSWQNVKGNASNYFNNATNAVSNWWGNVKDNISNKAASENKPVWQETIEVSLNINLNDPMSFIGGPEEGALKSIEENATEDFLKQIPKKFDVPKLPQYTDVQNLLDDVKDFTQTKHLNEFNGTIKGDANNIFNHLASHDQAKVLMDNKGNSYFESGNTRVTLYTRKSTGESGFQINTGSRIYKINVVKP